MKLQTKIEIEKYPFKISYSDKILFLGSCFANEMGTIMKRLRFKVLVNPFGVLYNPASISGALERLTSNRQFLESDVITDGDIYKSLYHSSEYASMSMEELIANNNRLLGEASSHFKESRWIVVTLGTRWIYRLKSNGVVVANCHKLDQGKFNREALSVDKVVDMFSPFILANPGKIWLFTVSPIRHWKDGAHGNQLSKATLMLAVEKLQIRFSNVLYFPAYEILMDELRDYRWYSEDMIHPSQFAVDYIWELLKENLTDEPAKELVKDINKLNLMSNHRPLFPESRNFLTFNKERKEIERKVEEKIKNL
ncbi:MAG: GSCFA domain-containing protein [Bacteroidales bacterium]